MSYIPAISYTYRSLKSILNKSFSNLDDTKASLALLVVLVTDVDEDAGVPVSLAFADLARRGPISVFSMAPEDKDWKL